MEDNVAYRLHEDRVPDEEAHKRVLEALQFVELENTIAEALDGHICRCTGYIKYHEAVRDVILADPTRYLV